MVQLPACAFVAAILALSAADLRAGVIRVTDTDAWSAPVAGAALGNPGYDDSVMSARSGAGGNAPFSSLVHGGGAQLRPESVPGLAQAGPALLGAAGLDQLLPANAAAGNAVGNSANNAGGRAGANAAPTPMPEAGTAALLAAALGAWLMLHAVIQRLRAARRARARGMAARTWSESRW